MANRISIIDRGSRIATSVSPPGPEREVCMRSSQPDHRARAFLFLAVAVFAGASRGLLGVCGPFTDVAADAFCPFVLEIFYLGITTGTTATTYDPTGNVTRLQMAAFLSRTVDGVARK